MTLKAPRLGETIVALSGLALAVSLALPWYETARGEVSAWGAFAVLDVLLVICVALAATVVALEVTQQTPALPVAMTSIAALVAIVATIWSALSLALGPVSGGAPRFAWLGLVAVAGIALGCLVAIRDEGTDFLPGVEEPAPPPK